MTVGLLELTETEPDAAAIDDGRRRRTRSELVDRAARIHQLLVGDLGLSAGSHLALLAGNRAEVIEWHLGAQLAGMWLTPLSRHLTGPEIAGVLADCGARLVITEPSLEEATHRAVDRVSPTPTVLVMGSSLDGMLAGVDPHPVTGTAAPGGAMFYTSGTTGAPKGVRRAAAPTVTDAFTRSTRAGRALGLDGGGPHLVTGPLYHAAPLGFALMDLHNGAELALMDRFDAERTLTEIDRRRVRATHLVPTMFVRLLALDELRRSSFDGSSLRTVLHGAAPITRSTKEAMMAWWGPCLTEYWGGSEGGVVTVATAEQWLANPGTVGRAIGGHEVYAGDEHGGRLPDGATGRLWCRHPSVSQVFEYHGDDTKTRLAHPLPGTYTLGDIGRVDEHGYVHLADRAANMIISGGVNIYPAEIEAVLSDHPAIADVAVFGVPDDEWGESVKAAVQLVDGRRWDPILERDLLDHARAQLAGYKVPRSFDVHRRLPRADTGKLAVRTLRDPYWAEHDRAI